MSLLVLESLHISLLNPWLIKSSIYQSDIFPIDFNTFHTSIENIQYSLKTKESLAYLKVSQFRVNFEAGYEEAFSKAI